MNQKERILGYLQELMESEKDPQEKAVIIRAQYAVKGGQSNENCTNDSALSCGNGVTNTSCINKHEKCALSTNKKVCYNQPIDTNMKLEECNVGPSINLQCTGDPEQEE